VKNNIYAYGIRGEGAALPAGAMTLMAEKRFDATKIHTHTFPLPIFDRAEICARANRRRTGGRHQPAGTRSIQRSGIELHSEQ